MQTQSRYVPLGFQQVTLGTVSATSLTVPAGATVAILKCDTANARWRDDGTAPTTTNGVPMLSTDNPLEYSGNLSAIQFIAQSGSPVLYASYYRVVG